MRRNIVENGQQTRRVLFLMPHPDDFEILCAGTALRLHAAGLEFVVCTMTAGDKGSSELSGDAIAAIRREEARRGAQTVSARGYDCLEFPDLEIVFDNVSRRKVAGLLRRVRPDMVFTTPPDDYLLDHEITARLVRDACFNAAVPNYPADGDSPPLEKVPYLYYTDAIGGADIYGRPLPVDLIVDISGQIERKANALACHESQRAWLRKQHGLDDYIDAMRRWCGGRGQIVGCLYGEGFRQHRGHPYPDDDLLAELLRDPASVSPTASDCRNRAVTSASDT